MIALRECFNLFNLEMLYHKQNFIDVHNSLMHAFGCIFSFLVLDFFVKNNETILLKSGFRKDEGDS